MSETAEAALRPSWRIRRGLIFATGAVCAGMIGASMSGIVESGVATTAIVTAAGLWGSVLGSYVFGAIWDDKNQRPN